MLENQAFGWLKLSIKGLGGSSTSPPAAVGNPGNSASIGACAALAGGVSRDLDALLLLHASSSLSTTTSTSPAADAPPLPPPGDGRLPTTAAAADDGGGGVAGAVVGARTTTLSSSYADSLDDLTARLDRIKYLLYEERSSRASAPSGAYRHGGGWTPPIAGGVLESFTTAAVASSKPKSESSATAAGGEGECSGGDGDDDSPDDGVPPPPDALLPRLVENLPLLPFEARKSVSAIFNYLLVCGLDGTDAGQFAGISEAFAAYVLRRADGIIGRLVRAHDCGTAAVGGGGGVDIALLCGSMLRSSLRHAPIYRWALSDPNCERLVYPFLEAHVHNPNFDVSSDALETVRVMLTGNASASAAAASSSSGGFGTMGDAHAEENRQIMEGIASDFLNRKYADVVDDRVNRMCLSPDANYMTRRMTLQLLSSILLNRANYNVMMMYISSSRNLVTILCLLRDPSPHITLDAFQVFKIFVANPNKVSRLFSFF
jgi:calcium binding protein 39